MNTDVNQETAPPSRKRRRGRKVILILLLILLVPILYLYLKPLNIGNLSEHAHFAQTYAEATERVRALDAPDKGKLGPLDGSLLLTHGKKTPKVIVFLHGYTKSPRQFAQFGQLFFDRGYNVLIPRLPHHGIADRMTTEQSLLTAEELATFADEVVDIAHGLGDDITVVGLSAGGVTTSWAAQHRADISRAVILSPAFGYKDLTTAFTRPGMNLYLTLPNSYNWWDKKAQERLVPANGYPRWSTHALAQLLRLGFATQQRAAEQSPAAHSILVVTNAADAAVNNEMTAKVVAHWQQNANDKVHTFEFPASQNLDHDLIDPENPKQQIKTVYPKLLELIPDSAGKP